MSAGVGVEFRRGDVLADCCVQAHPIQEISEVSQLQQTRVAGAQLQDCADWDVLVSQVLEPHSHPLFILYLLSLSICRIAIIG